VACPWQACVPVLAPALGTCSSHHTCEAAAPAFSAFPHTFETIIKTFGISCICPRLYPRSVILMPLGPGRASPLREAPTHVRSTLYKLAQEAAPQSRLDNDAALERAVCTIIWTFRKASRLPQSPYIIRWCLF
jgi:hypothetical protein